MLQSRTEVKRNGTCAPSISNRPNPSQRLNSSDYQRWLVLSDLLKRKHRETRLEAKANGPKVMPKVAQGRPKLGRLTGKCQNLDMRLGGETCVSSQNVNFCNVPRRFSGFWVLKMSKKKNAPPAGLSGVLAWRAFRRTY
ncbi:BQ5605_C003g02425 [Microbotryum silenes-dioicae]|uniref:BQ5605_C003g02425 protein n=1 Tax=Microbotryum silenes-dioicae TaxID=796604 RepID=A0A2X0M1L3_9BASI|nr:BQ5605_C003g02425 [Microbotryum silenes-dioicae]